MASVSILAPKRFRKWRDPLMQLSFVRVGRHKIVFLNRFFFAEKYVLLHFAHSNVEVFLIKRRVLFITPHKTLAGGLMWPPPLLHFQIIFFCLWFFPRCFDECLVVPQSHLGTSLPLPLLLYFCSLSFQNQALAASWGRSSWCLGQVSCSRGFMDVCHLFSMLFFFARKKPRYFCRSIHPSISSWFYDELGGEPGSRFAPAVLSAGPMAERGPYSVIKSINYTTLWCGSFGWRLHNGGGNLRPTFLRWAPWNAINPPPQTRVQVW